jgi:serine/threonine-protein kinase
MPDQPTPDPLPPAGDTTPAASPGSAGEPDLPALAGRYVIEEEVARGGMGVVLRAHDPRLGRSLAVKILLDRHAGDPAMSRRFLEEARVCGQLQHPGVPPIHDLGELADGRPFFAMKLVKGHTLAQLLRQRRGLAEDLPHLVGVFVQVCQAVAYAHSRGIIHRDLKPANVMVGAFGEVQVMDWGLAKILGGTPAPVDELTIDQASTLFTTRAADSDSHTQAGTILGTPSYMAPEQARGQVGYLDERADVFGLGAVLCEILTGQPPYPPGGTGAVIERAAEGDLGEARQQLAGCGADAELVRLALSCLEFQPALRPRNAGEVARQLAEYQAGVQERLRRAELAQAEALVKAREERKRRRVLVGLAVALLALVVGTGTVVAWLRQQRAELRRGVESALDRVAALQEQARWKEAQTVLDGARERLGGSGPNDLQSFVEQAQADLDLTVRLDRIRLQLIRTPGSGLDHRACAEGYAAAFRETGLGEVGDDVEAVAQRVRNSAIRERLLAALDHWALVTWRMKQGGGWMLAIARRASPEGWANRLREESLWLNPAAVRRLVRPPEAAKLPSHAAWLLGSILFAHGEDSVPLLTAAQSRDPTDFWLNLALGEILAETDRPADAVGYFRAALAVRPDAALVYGHLGNALYRQGKWEDALAAFEKLLDLAPGDSIGHNNRGIILWEKGQPDAAVAAFRKAAALAPSSAKDHYNLGKTLADLGRLDESIAPLRRAVLLNPSLARARFYLADALRSRGRLDEALGEAQQAVRLFPRDPEAHYQFGLALLAAKHSGHAIRAFLDALALDPRHTNVLCDLGRALWLHGCREEALAAFRQTIAVDPGHRHGWYYLGLSLAQLGRFDEAYLALREAVLAKPSDGAVYSKFGSVLAELGRLDEARDTLRAGAALGDRDGTAHNTLGSALKARGRVEEAIAAFQTAAQMNPKLAAVHYNLGNTLRDAGRPDEAVAAFRQAIAVQPDFAQAHCNLGLILRRQGHFRASLEALRKGHRLGSRQPDWKYPSARWVKEAERTARLEEKLPAVLAGKERPTSAVERLQLAWFCQYHKKLYAASAHFYAEAFAEKQELVKDGDLSRRYDAACAAALAAAGQGKDAASDEKERARLRQHALDWLGADLGLLAKQIDKAAEVRAQAVKTLKHWQQDTDLASVRDREALARLPETERSAWVKLWAEVDDLLRRLSEEK